MILEIAVAIVIGGVILRYFEELLWIVLGLAMIFIPILIIGLVLVKVFER